MPTHDFGRCMICNLPFSWIAGHKSFRSAFAERINVLMSNYVLFERKTEEGIPELIALLLVTNWPREHARSDLESNAVLFHIISSIKGWLVTIIGEVNNCTFYTLTFLIISAYKS